MLQTARLLLYHFNSRWWSESRELIYAAAAACMQVCQTHMVLLRSQLLLWASWAEDWSRSTVFAKHKSKLSWDWFLTCIQWSGVCSNLAMCQMELSSWLSSRKFSLSGGLLWAAEDRRSWLQEILVSESWYTCANGLQHGMRSVICSKLEV